MKQCKQCKWFCTLLTELTILVPQILAHVHPSAVRNCPRFPQQPHETDLTKRHVPQQHAEPVLQQPHEAWVTKRHLLVVDEFIPSPSAPIEVIISRLSELSRIQSCAKTDGEANKTLINAEPSSISNNQQIGIIIYKKYALYGYDL